MRRYALGIDFGTLSARATLVCLGSGSVAAVSSFSYPHGVMDQALPSGRPLARGWALEHPLDYWNALLHIVPDVQKRAGISGAAVAAIGVDFTCSSTLPVLADGTPLCTLAAFADEPHAYVKLWKHHADAQAAHIAATAHRLKLPWLHVTGGRVSGEWLLPKLLELIEEAPALAEKTAVYLEAGDWIIWKLCGRLCRSESYAAYKNFYQDGRYPDAAFWSAVHPALSGAASSFLRGEVAPLSRCAGVLAPDVAALLSLPPGIPVAPGMTDSHTGVLSAGLCESGEMLSILGTSACHILLHADHRPLTGIAGGVRDGILPGLTAYEANQSMGDTFAWYLQNACPASCAQEAWARGLSLHAFMTEKAAALPPGGDGLLALDWFGGNRCILGDGELSAMLLGMTLQTRPEAIYRALLESSAYAMRTIIEQIERQGLPVRRIVAMGGVAQKNPLLMQVIADVLGRELAVSSVQEGAAQGAAIAAAACAGLTPSVEAAVRTMGQPVRAVYRPGGNQAAYDALYREYTALHDYFGRGGSEVMHRLARLSASSVSSNQPID